ncbi:CLUMA_CG016442, isoform A [Clunio marinus]|uniref:Spondin-1 n=1 Tax=Clunio marinus TaxID=568069 RepID=A0A1J1IXD9_9DIPT|nr:CLUMA_CG016442, isoform A [Clunio marinus]
MRNSIMLLKIILVVNIAFVHGSGLRCDRTPEASSAQKSPPDGRFRLMIANDPQRYLPGETYNITLEGISRFYQLTQQKFTGFFVTVEPDFSDIRHADLAFNEINVGRFLITDNAASKFSEKCQNLVTHTSSVPKSEVMISWTAPPLGSGCLVFKSTVIEHRDVWYSDDGALSKVLCEDDADSGDTQPFVLEECTACDEAKYELTFEGLWSRHTHPKDFPDNGWLTKFSDVIGASHTREFRFWTYGEAASEGLKELAEHGSTRQLERELKDEGEHIRTIIKARGISYPNVTGKTFAVFAQLSFVVNHSDVSMIYPSPDWFVGVSGLELCLGNGSWVEEKILNLYPYDAGTDSGPTYISSDQPTIPKEAIRRIKPNQPNDPRSPFHDPENMEMKPLARLYISRQRLYEKNCENQENNQYYEQESVKDCAVTRWSQWSDCDSPCGKGQRTRQRSFRNPGLSYDRSCKKKLIEYEECQGTDDNCNDDRNDYHDRNENEAEQDPENQDPECTLTAWTEFGECSKPCGRGQRTRTREYVNRHNQKRCQKRNPVELEETEDCDGLHCSGDIDENQQQVKDIQKNHRNCPVTRYSPYSQCSVSCGLGQRVRVRIPSTHQRRDENLQKIIHLYNKLTSRNNRYNDDYNDDDEKNFMETDVREISVQDHPCYGTELIDVSFCGVRDQQCDDDEHGIPVLCLLKPPLKRCNETIKQNRWYYRKAIDDCGIYLYTGCDDNLNSFESQEECLKTCRKDDDLDNNLKSSQTENSREQIWNSIRSHSLSNYGREMDEKIDCKVSHWKHEPCNATCGEGYRWKFKSIIQHPQNGGLPCPRTLFHFERCFKDCGSTRIIAMPTKGNSVHSHHHHQCRYSNWSAWSPCSKTCGESAVQIRTRTVLNHQTTHSCNERLEERRCEVMPCLVGSGYNYNYNYRS